MVTLLCWLPFILTVLIFGTVSLILGYKRGYIRAAISVLSTVISAVIALIVSKLAASAVAGKLGGLISDIADLDGILSGDALNAVAAALTAILLFGPVFVIVSAIIKNVCSVVNGKYIKKPEKAGEKLGGLAISVVDTLLFAILLTLPVYGTLAVASPIAEAAISLTADKSADEKEEAPALRAPVVYGSFCGTGRAGSVMRLDSELLAPVGDTDNVPESADAKEIADLLTRVFNIPLCKLAEAAPFRAVYDSLGTVKIGGEKVSVTETVRDAGKVAKSVADAVDSGALGENKQNELAIIDGLDELFKNSSFVRTVACEMIKNVKPDGKFGEVIKDYAENVDPDSMKDDVSALCDVLRSAVENGVVKEIVDNKDDVSALFAEGSALTGDFIYDLTSALNSTRSLAGIKSGLINTAASSLGLSGESEEALRDALSHITADPLSADDAEKEGDSFRQIVISIGKAAKEDTESAETFEGAAGLIEGLARHPSITKEDTDKIIDSFISTLGVEGLDADSPIIDTFKKSLEESVEKPVGEGTLGTLARASADLAEMISDVSEDRDCTARVTALLTEDKSALGTLAETLTPEAIAPLGLSDTPGVPKVMSSLLTAMANADLTEEKARTEAQSISDVMRSVVSSVKSKNITSDEMTELVDKAKVSGIVTEAVRLTVTENGKTVSDPLSLGLTKTVRNTVKTALNNYLKTDSSDTTKILAANLALLFGADK